MKWNSALHTAAMLADEAWQQQLVKVFGKGAGDARYVSAGKGEPGSALRAAHDARQQATEAWRASIVYDEPAPHTDGDRK